MPGNKSRCKIPHGLSLVSRTYLLVAATGTHYYFLLRRCLNVSYSLFSNKPGEDAISLLPFNKRKLGYIGIYDGHNGDDLSKALCDTLLPKLSTSVNLVYKTFQRPIPSEAIDKAIKGVFVGIDTEIIHRAAQKALGLDAESYKKLNEATQENSTPSPDPPSRTVSKHEAVKILKLANAGSCVMTGIFDANDRSLRIALTGDLRAVFGRRVPLDDDKSGENTERKTYVYEVEALTADQNANNPSEAARLSAAHPHEEDLLKHGRVLGWGPSRSFGDGTMKWSRAVRRRLKEECLGDIPRENYKTPPYFTAEPVITTKEGIQKGDFVVLATDGLWECFENEEVVGLVGQWLETHGTKETVNVPGSKEVKEVMVPPRASLFSRLRNIGPAREGKIYTPSDLPVVYPPNFKDNSPRYRYWRAEKKFVCRDKDSVAEHLIRNALGGADKDLHNALLEYKPPRSRRFR